MEGELVPHVDVLIVGAGLSGVGAATHLQKSCPDKTFAILEARATSGGTWDLFRYPGIRSDSDMYTLAYRVKPWMGTRALGDGPSIARYIREMAAERGIDRAIRYHHRVRRASWSSADARWTVEVERTDTGTTEHLTCGFLFGNTGYYRYDAGYTPEFPGRESFGGLVLHPQHWPEDLDYSGRRIAVIGSGATAVTLVPALADSAGHVTMVQRSPSYIASLPGENPIDEALRRRLPPRASRAVIRWKNMVLTSLIYQLCRRAPAAMKKRFRESVATQLPSDYDVDTHFTPPYEPWDQRLCFAPDGDLFTAIREGKVSVVTETIESFTPTGLRFGSGAELEADIIVTATGITMLMLGGMEIEVDGRRIETSEAVTYKSLMMAGVPNLAFTFGYTNASWTLKSDLVAGYVCRLLRYMDRHGYATCTPNEPDPALPTSPYLDLTSGYVQRSNGVPGTFPRQTTTAPWRVRHNYPLDVLLFRYGRVDDGVTFARAPARRPASPLPV
ncbi:MAG: flavin-containing monooxygenase [Acidimicrobiales bacterium]